MGFMGALASRLVMRNDKEVYPEYMEDLPEDENRGVILPLNDGSMQETAVQVPFIPRSNRSNSVHRGEMGVHSTHKSVQNMFNDKRNGVQINVQKHEWMWKARRNKGIVQNMLLLRVVLSGIVVAYSIYLTGICADRMHCTYSYMIALAVILLSDPLDTAGRVLALPSRIMAAFTLLLITFAHYYCIDSLITMGWCVCGLTAVVILIRNNFWLRAENWSYTDNVTKALILDPDNNAGVSWYKGGGKKEVRTMLHQIGKDVSELDLEGMMQCVYSLGYWKEYQKKTAMEEQIAELHDQLQEQNETVQEAQRIIGSYAEASKTESEYEQLWKEAVQKNERLQKLYKELKQNYDQMEIALEEMETAAVDTVPEKITEDLPEVEQVPTGREDLKEYVYRKYNEGLSFKQIGELIGRSKGTAYNLYNEYIAELEEESSTGTKVINGRW